MTGELKKKNINWAWNGDHRLKNIGSTEELKALREKLSKLISSFKKGYFTDNGLEMSIFEGKIIIIGEQKEYASYSNKEMIEKILEIIKERGISDDEETLNILGRIIE